MKINEFVDKILLFEKREALESFSGMVASYQLIESLNWLDRFIVFRGSLKDERINAVGLFEMFFTFETIMNRPGFLGRAARRLFFSPAYKQSVTALKKYQPVEA